VRLLLDDNLSPRLVDVLAKAGWDVVHVGRWGLRAASDLLVLHVARDDGRVLDG
jgi:predicted nuclease of predicted toxin-antitoxin system